MKLADYCDKCGKIALSADLNKSPYGMICGDCRQSLLGISRINTGLDLEDSETYRLPKQCYRCGDEGKILFKSLYSDDKVCNKCLSLERTEEPPETTDHCDSCGNPTLYFEPSMRDENKHICHACYEKELENVENETMNEMVSLVKAKMEEIEQKDPISAIERIRAKSSAAKLDLARYLALCLDR